jgi:tetratricopeptide (TPR) repeat protein
VRSFFLFYLLSQFLRSPLLALIVVGVVVYVFEARHSGRYFNPTTFLRRRGAIHDLERTIENNEHDVAAHNDLGRLLADAGEYERATPHLEKAIVRMDELPETNFYHGLCLLEKGQRDEGRRFVERAIEINKRYGYGRPQVVLARDAMAHGDHERAKSWARQAVGMNTSSVEGWVLYGRAEVEAGNPEAAREAFLKAKDAFDGLPHYLRIGERRWLKEAKRELKNGSVNRA